MKNFLDYEGGRKWDLELIEPNPSRFFIKIDKECKF